MTMIAATTLVEGDAEGPAMVWTVPLWPVAFAVAAGSVLFLTGVFLHLVNAWVALSNPRRVEVPAAASQPYRE